MTTTKTKTKKTAKKATTVSPSLVPCPEAYRVCPTDRRTGNGELTALLKAIAAYEDDAALSVRADYVAGLSDEDFAALWAWAREIDWAVDGRVDGQDDGQAEPAARASRLVVPACFATLVASDLATPEAAKTTLQVIDDRAADPASEPPASAAAEATSPETRPTAPPLPDVPPTPMVEKDGQIALVAEPVKPATLKPMEFLAGDEVASVRLSLIARADDLDAEAKRLNGLGKTAEAQSVLREAKNIRHRLLPQVTAQQALAFNDKETLPAALARVVQGEVRARARRALTKNLTIKKGETKKDAEQRQLGKLDDLEALIGNIGEQVGAIVTRLLVEAADRGNQYGLRGMTCTPDVIARDAIHAIEQEQQQEQAAA